MPGTQQQPALHCSLAGIQLWLIYLFEGTVQDQAGLNTVFTMTLVWSWQYVEMRVEMTHEE